MQKQVNNKNFFTTRKLVFMAVFIAMSVVLTRFLVISLPPDKRISLSYIPIVYAAITLGPVSAGIVAAIADVIGALLFPQGAFFPGFTLTAFISGILYGAFLHRKNIKWYHIVLARLVVVIVCQWGLNNLWLTMIISGKSFGVLFLARIVPDLIQFPIDLFILFPVVSFIRRSPVSLRP